MAQPVTTELKPAPKVQPETINKANVPVSPDVPTASGDPVQSLTLDQLQGLLKTANVERGDLSALREWIDAIPEPSVTATIGKAQITADSKVPVQGFKSFANSMLNLIEAASGKRDPAISDAVALAGTGIGVNAAMGFPKMSVGIFGSRIPVLRSVEENSPLRRQLQLAMIRANELAGSGATKEEILGETGLHRDFHGNWTFEVSDDAMAASPKLLDAADEVRFLAYPPAHSMTLEDALSHPKAFEYFPYLKTVDVSFDPSFRQTGTMGSFHPSLNLISLNPDLPKTALLPTILHETQHAVQSFETQRYGLTKGVGTNQNTAFNKFAMLTEGPPSGQNAIKNFDKVKQDWLAGAKDAQDTGGRLGLKNFGLGFAHKLYKADPGEVQARNTQLRMFMRAFDRRFMHPDETQDIPFDKQVDFNSWIPPTQP